MLPDLRIWLEHFSYHAGRVRRLPAHLDTELTAAEQRLIAGPLAALRAQQEETGPELLAAGYGFAERHRAPEVARIIELLVRESRQNAGLIVAFMAGHRMTQGQSVAAAPIRRIVPGDLQRQLECHLRRQLARVVCCRALEGLTRNQQLRLLCRMLVADELAHIGFASDLLLALRAAQPALLRFLLELREQTLGVMTAIAAWWVHRKVLCRAGYGLPQFVQATRLQYAFYMQPLARP